MHSFRHAHIATLLALLLGTNVFAMAVVHAADADGDGVSDVEEIQEFGTDPFIPDFSGVVADAQVHLLSLPPEFSLVGESLLVTGFAPRHVGTVEVDLVQNQETLSTLLVRPDDRGVFSGVWDLSDVCAAKGKGTYDIVVENKQQNRMTMLCDTSHLPMPLENLHFAGKAIDPAHPTSTVIAQSDDAVLEAVGQPWLRLYSVYASVLFSKEMFADDSGRLRVTPWKTLAPGKHALYVMPHDPIRRLLYAPIVVPFEIVSPLGEDLKASMYYAPGGILIIGAIFFGSVTYIRRLRALRRGILWAGERYPDELY